MHEDLYKAKELIALRGTAIAKGKEDNTSGFYLKSFLRAFHGFRIAKDMRKIRASVIEIFAAGSNSNVKKTSIAPISSFNFLNNAFNKKQT